MPVLEPVIIDIMLCTKVSVEDVWHSNNGTAQTFGTSTIPEMNNKAAANKQNVALFSMIVS